MRGECAVFLYLDDCGESVSGRSHLDCGRANLARSTVSVVGNSEKTNEAEWGYCSWYATGISLAMCDSVSGVDRTASKPELMQLRRCKTTPFDGHSLPARGFLPHYWCPYPHTPLSQALLPMAL
jgi:hypothetical protein